MQSPQKANFPKIESKTKTEHTFSTETTETTKFYNRVFEPFEALLEGLYRKEGLCKMYESGFENYITTKIRKAGGRAFKWVCSGMTGAPDRICVFPAGRIIFIELKRPGLKDGRSERQKKVCRLLRSLGCDVRRIGEKEEFVEMMKEVGYEV